METILPPSFRDYMSGTENWPVERRRDLVKSISTDIGLTLLKVHLVVVCNDTHPDLHVSGPSPRFSSFAPLLRAARRVTRIRFARYSLVSQFSSLACFSLRRCKAVVTAHNIIVVHHQLINQPDISFFTSPLPLQTAAMVLLYGW